MKNEDARSCRLAAYLNLLFERSSVDMKHGIRLRQLFIACIGGGASIWLGILIMRKGIDYRSGFPVPRVSGLLICLFGICLILHAFLSKNIPKGYDDSFVICVGCGSSYYAKDVNRNVCPKCGGMVEDSKGFYDRHPETRNRS